MPLFNCLGVVLRTHPYREHDKLVTLFTREQGKLRAVARGGRRPQSHWGAALEVFTFLDLLLFEKERNFVITQWQIKRSHHRLRTNLELGTSASYFAEIVDELTHEGDPNPGVFHELEGVLSALEKKGDLFSLGNSLILKLLSLLGFGPRWESCSICGKSTSETVYHFSPEAGGILCSSCLPMARANIIVSAQAILRARDLLTSSWEEINRKEEDRELWELLQLFLSTHFGMRSSLVMRFRAQMRESRGGGKPPSI